MKEIITMRQKKLLLKVTERMQNKMVRGVKEIIIKMTRVEEKLKSTVIFLRKEENLCLTAS